jgi:type IV secretory pathway TrbD component
MYRALTEPQLVSGCERSSFFALLGVCLLVGFLGGLAAGRWMMVVLSVALFWFGKIALGQAAKRDPHLREVVIRSNRYGTRLVAVPDAKEGR